jgi:hypothetical protein
MAKQDRQMYESKVEVAAPIVAPTRTRATARTREAMRINLLAEITGGFSSRCCFHIAKGREVRLTGDGTRVSKFGQIDLCDGVAMDIELPVSKLEE